MKREIYLRTGKPSQSVNSDNLVTFPGIFVAYLINKFQLLEMLSNDSNAIQNSNTVHHASMREKVVLENRKVTSYDYFKGTDKRLLITIIVLSFIYSSDKRIFHINVSRTSCTGPNGSIFH